MANNVGNIYIKATDETKEAMRSITANLKGMEAGLKSTADNVKRLAGAFLAFQGTQKIFEGVAEAINIGDRFDDLSEKLGITSQEFQRFQYIAEQNGTSAETLLKGIKNLSLQMAQGTVEGSKANQMFKQMGISINDLKNKSPEEMFGIVADKLNTYSDSAEKTALSNALLGKSSEELAALIKQGSTALEEQKKHFDELGITMSNNFSAKAAELNDRISEMKQGFYAVIGSGLESYLPAIINLVEQLTGVVGDTNKELQKTANTKESIYTATNSIETLANAVYKTWQVIDPFISAFSTGMKAIKLVAMDAIEYIVGLFRTLGARTAQVTEALGNIADGEFKKAWNSLDFGKAIDYGFRDAGKSYNENMKALANSAKDTNQKFSDLITKPFKEIKITPKISTGSPERSKGGNIAAPNINNDVKAANDKALQDKLKQLEVENSATKQYYDQALSYYDELNKNKEISDKEYLQIKLDLINNEAQQEISILEKKKTLTKDSAEKEKIDLQINAINYKIYIENLKTVNLLKQKDIELQTARNTRNQEHIDFQIKMIELNGDLTEEQKVEKINELQKQKIDLLVKELQAKQALLQVSGNEQEALKLQKDIEDLQVKIGEANNVIKSNNEALVKDLKNDFKGFFTDVIKGTKSINQQFSDMLSNISDRILNSAIDKMLNDLFRNVSFGGSGSSGGGFDFGGMIRSGFSWLGGLLGFADGGDVLPSNKPIIVGERGPELWMPKTGGYIMNNKDLTSGIKSNNSTAIINVYANDARSFRSSDTQIQAQVNLAVKRANRNL